MEIINNFESNFIESIMYEGTTLSITFKGGKSYNYLNFPEPNWNGFKDADSKGSYFHKFIKGQYKTVIKEETTAEII